MGRPKELAMAAAPARGDDEIVHTDVYFDVESAQLGADAAHVLEERAVLMDVSGVWVVLVHGYADRQEAVGCGKLLARQRAEAVKRLLVQLGVSETSVNVALGPDGSPCDESRRNCREHDRRVHVEMRRLGDAVIPSRPAWSVEL